MSGASRHRTYVGLIERGQHNLSLGTIEIIAGGVPVTDLFTGVETESGAGRKPIRGRGSAHSDLSAQVAAIRQILVDAKLTDVRRLEALVKTKRETTEI